MTIEVQLTEKLFTDYAIFDILRKHGGWRPPVIFMLIFIFLSVVSFILAASVEIPIITVLAIGLLVLAFAFPLVYFLTFFRTVRKQSEKLDLPSLVYIVKFTEEGMVLVVTASGHTKAYPLSDVSGLYLVEDAAYLYASEEDIYILPLEKIDGGFEALINITGKYLPDERLVDKR